MRGRGLHIAVDASWACGQRTGTGNYTLHLVRALIEHAAHHRLTLYFRQCCRTDNPLFPLEYPNVAKKVVDARSTLWRIYATLPRKMAAARPDVFVAPAYFTPLFGAKRFVATYYDAKVFSFGPERRAHGGITSYVLLRVLFPLGIWRADRVVAISKSTLEELSGHYPSVRQKGVVIYPGVDPKPSNLTESLQVPPCIGEDRDYILYVGALSPEKNVERAIQAFWRYRSENSSGAAFLLAGASAGSYRQDVLEPLVDRLGLTEHVHFLGYVLDNQLGLLYARASALMFPSLGEGFGYPILEAMHYGCPVLTSATTSCPEVGGEAAVYVNPESVEDIYAGLARLMGDSGLRARLRDAGRIQARKFSVQRMAQEYLEFLEELCGPSG